MTTHEEAPIDHPRLAIAFAAIISLVSAGVVVWHLGHVAVLLDLSYVLNNAQRIASGDVPYRDFPLPYPPLTFLIQAALIRIAGAHYAVASAYAIVIDAISVALSYAIVLRIVRRAVVAAAVCAPLAVLGVHDIYPHPFYDPDATVLMLAALAATLWALDRPGHVPAWLAAGALLPLPILAKQNSGIAFFVLTLAAAAVALQRERRLTDFAPLAGGAAVTIAAAAVVLQLTAGLGAVIASTVGLASARLANAAPPLAWLVDPGAWVGVALTLAGGAALRRGGRARLYASVAVVLPFAIFAGLGLALPSAQTLLSLWPFGTLLATLACARAALSGRTFVSLLPFLCAGVATAAFLSQGVWGSSYALWPLLAIAFAAAVRQAQDPRIRLGPIVTVVIPTAGILALVAAVAYVGSDARLSFIRLEGTVATSAFPSLAGLSTPGPFVSDLDTALGFIAAHVPASDELVAVPGEDPIYFALGRGTRFPVVEFVATTNPYAPRELTALRDSVGVRWVLVKQELQFSFADLAANAAALTEGYELVGTAGSYAVYLRPGP